MWLPKICFGFNLKCQRVRLRVRIWDRDRIIVQWNLVITRSDITKFSYNEVILLVPALYISVFLP